MTGQIVVGDLVVLTWSSCAGPCTEYSIIDSSGRPKGIQGAGGGGVLQVDAKRFVVLSEFALVNVHELGTGKRLSSIDLAAEPAPLDAVRIDDESIFVMTDTLGGRRVTKVALPPGKDKPHAGDSMFLPRCTP